MSTERTRVVDAILALGIAPALAAHGFRCERRVWRRRRGDAIQIVAVHGTWDLTLDLALHYPSIAKLLGQPVVRRPTARHSHFEERIGFLWAGRDYWWRLDRDADRNDIAVDMAEKVERFALPWLDERAVFADASRCAEGVRARSRVRELPVALAIAAGDGPTAQRRYDEALATARFQYERSALERLMRYIERPPSTSMVRPLK